MKQRPRRYITDSEMALIWDRWEKGDSINAIARDLGRPLPMLLDLVLIKTFLDIRLHEKERGKLSAAHLMQA
jgi:hypothetical protein